MRLAEILVVYDEFFGGVTENTSQVLNTIPEIF